jgi:hypothetical protein
MLLSASKNHTSTAYFTTRLSLSAAKSSSFSAIIAKFTLQALACQKNSAKATRSAALFYLLFSSTTIQAALL